jgi:hypothetical protein
MWTAADHGRVRDRVVGRSERASAHQLAERCRARNRCHDRRDQRLLVGQRWQQARHRARQQRLSRTRGPDHRHAVAACQSQLQGSPRLQLAAHLGQVRDVPGFRGVGSRKLRRQINVPADAVRQLDPGRAALGAPSASSGKERCGLGQGLGGHDLDAARESRLFDTFRGNHHATQLLSGQGRDHGQHARHGPQLAPERQLAQNGPASGGPDLLRSDQDPEGDRQIQ